MALTYPIEHPTSIGFESITLRAVDATAATTSPFTLRQQVLNWGGQRWEVDVTIPTVRRDLAAPWKAFLLSLKGQQGTFLMGDPDYSSPRGTATVVDVNAAAGSDELFLTNLDGTLKAGDYIQVGSGSAARLHTLLEDVDSDGSYNVWPNARTDYSALTGILNDPKGVFRLQDKTRQYSINTNSQYSMSFSAVEVI